MTAAVYRICKKCWRSTKHIVFEDKSKKIRILRCEDCGFQLKEKDNG